MDTEYKSADTEAGHDHTALPRPGRRLPAAVQGMALLVLGGVLVALLFVLPAIVGLAAPAEAPEQDSSGPFKPTDQQWAGLKVKQVAQMNYAPQVETEGRIAFDDDLTTPVVSPYSGRVTRVFVRAGAQVSVGSPLFAVQSQELAQAQNDLVSGLATLRTAHAQLDLAVANESRLHQLYLGHGAALKDWQQSRVDLATARGGLSSAAIAVAAVRNRLAILGVNRTEIASIVNAPDLEREAADTIVRAPVAGAVMQRAINPGQTIVGSVTSQGSAGAVFTIGDMSKLWMIASAREDDAGRLHVGDLARVTVPAFPGHVFDARVSLVSGVIDPNTHRLLVRAEVQNPGGMLKPDMLADFEIVTGAASSILAVPEIAVVFEGSDAHVWVADPVHKTLALRPIEVGASDHGMIQVVRGLSAGESVVTSGAVFIDRTLSDS